MPIEMRMPKKREQVIGFEASDILKKGSHVKVIKNLRHDKGIIAVIGRHNYPFQKMQNKYAQVIENAHNGKFYRVAIITGHLAGAHEWFCIAELEKVNTPEAEKKMIETIKAENEEIQPEVEVEFEEEDNDDDDDDEAEEDY